MVPPAGAADALLFFSEQETRRASRFGEVESRVFCPTRDLPGNSASQADPEWLLKTEENGIFLVLSRLLAAVNQRLPSGLAEIPKGLLLAVGRENWVMVPLGLIRPILLLSISGNQRIPSGPAVMSSGRYWLWEEGPG
jgi:hypothetical protein